MDREPVRNACLGTVKYDSTCILWQWTNKKHFLLEISKQRFIKKPPACWGTDISIEIYQLLLLFSITGWECFDISKAFDKVWHDGNFEISSKWHIMEFSQAYARLFRWEKTTHSSQWSSLRIDKYHCCSTSRFHSRSIFVFNLYKWFLWRTFYQCKFTCGRSCSIFLCYLASISHVSLCKYELGFTPN